MLGSDVMLSTVGKVLQPVAEHSLAWTCLASRYGQLTGGNRLSSLLSLLLDLGLGWLVFTTHLPSPLPDTVHLVMDTTVDRLQALLNWMMENPAGLKLNSVLSQALGNFFLYHIHLWVTYVVLVLPLLLPLATFLSLASLSLQLALLGDLFSLLTVHIHCFYAYARRLALSQYRGLVALWRLFIGKKYNPLRDRVDSADCTVEQLFLGTIVFTILLFLLPTSLTFFCVFATLKFSVLVVIFLLRKIVSVIHWLPS